MPLVPYVTSRAFDKWVVDFVGPINPPAKRSGAHYIITTTNYVTRWDEATPIRELCDNNTNCICKFDNPVWMS